MWLARFSFPNEKKRGRPTLFNKGGGGATVDVPDSCVASGEGGTVSEARAEEICSVIARR
jgi:hypothetical protein